MIQLVYTSAARIPFSTEALHGLLSAARRRNAAQQITGLLLYDRGSFIQAIEGRPGAIDETFERIKRDPSHHRLTVLARRVIEAREFSEWQMGFSTLEEVRRLEVPGFANLFAEGSTHRFTLEGARILLEAFRVGRFRSYVATGPVGVDPS